MDHTSNNVTLHRDGPIEIRLTTDAAQMQSPDTAQDTWAPMRRKFPLTKASPEYLRVMRAQLACLVSQIDADLAYREAKRRGEITTDADYAERVASDPRA